MDKYQPKDTVHIKILHETYNFATDAWAAAAPDAIAVTLTDSQGTVVLNAAGMTLVATGKYQYLYQLAVNAPSGQWQGYIEVTNGGYTDREYFVFKVE